MKATRVHNELRNIKGNMNNRASVSSEWKDILSLVLVTNNTLRMTRYIPPYTTTSLTTLTLIDSTPRKVGSKKGEQNDGYKTESFIDRAIQA